MNPSNLVDRLRSKAAASAVVALLSLVSGCAAPALPQPWEKGNLAKPEMGMTGDALEQRYTQHIYTSKENNSGGYGVGGGGCGCN
jgi:Domain of unknown function (DUF4266)